MCGYDREAIWTMGDRGLKNSFPYNNGPASTCPGDISRNKGRLKRTAPLESSRRKAANLTRSAPRGGAELNAR
jgi:hypothetical protein